MWRPLASLFALTLSACSVQIPNVVVCSTAGYMSAGADCAESLSDETKVLTLDEWIAFLEPNIETGRGAALCLSSEDFTKLKTALDQACSKLGRWCSKEIKEETQKAEMRVASLQSRVAEKKRKRHHK